jgi:hypothetical protein
MIQKEDFKKQLEIIETTIANPNNSEIIISDKSDIEKDDTLDLSEYDNFELVDEYDNIESSEIKDKQLVLESDKDTENEPLDLSEFDGVEVLEDSQ